MANKPVLSYISCYDFSGDIIKYPANIYLFKVNNRNTRKRWNILKVNSKNDFGKDFGTNLLVTVTMLRLFVSLLYIFCSKKVLLEVSYEFGSVHL